jgi:hypothetical protein
MKTEHRYDLSKQMIFAFDYFVIILSVGLFLSVGKILFRLFEAVLRWIVT